MEDVFNAILYMQADGQIGALSYECSTNRVTKRNGYRDRQVTTRVGSLILHIPKFHDGTFSTQLFESYERNALVLLLSIIEMIYKVYRPGKSLKLQKYFAIQNSLEARFLRYVRSLIVRLYEISREKAVKHQNT